MRREAAAEHLLTRKEIEDYREYLVENEKSAGTVDKYLRDINALAGWLAKENGCRISKDAVLRWRAQLMAQGLAPRTINAKLSAVNGLLRCLGLEHCRVRFLKVQRRLFRAKEKDLTRTEYERLLKTASDRGNMRLQLLMETLCATGIRVSEVRYITVGAVQNGQVDILCKGKVRTILLPGKLCRKLRRYARACRITRGALFCTRTGRVLSRRQVWAEMKGLCAAAGVAPTKVFPHNLRHLFALTFYTACKDIVRLSDALGHSSIETTRIYLISTKEEITRLLDRMRLVQ